MRPQTFYTHTKYPKRKFGSNYRYTAGDRYFTLTNGKRIISYESAQAAMRDGWKRIYLSPTA